MVDLLATTMGLAWWASPVVSSDVCVSITSPRPGRSFFVTLCVLCWPWEKPVTASLFVWMGTGWVRRVQTATDACAME